MDEDATHLSDALDEVRQSATRLFGTPPIAIQDSAESGFYKIAFWLPITDGELADNEDDA